MTLPITPITDRTKADVDYANVHRDAATPNKGALNHTDLNRIEANCSSLSEQLNGYGYSVRIITKTDWAMTDFPTLGHLDRIRGNINALTDCYNKMQGSPEIRFWDSLDWNDANSLEQNVLNLNILIERMIKGFWVSGGFNFYSGSEVVLP